MISVIFTLLRFRLVLALHPTSLNDSANKETWLWKFYFLKLLLVKFLNTETRIRKQYGIHTET